MFVEIDLVGTKLRKEVEEKQQLLEGKGHDILDMGPHLEGRVLRVLGGENPRISLEGKTQEAAWRGKP